MKPPRVKPLAPCVAFRAMFGALAALLVTILSGPHSARAMERHPALDDGLGAYCTSASLLGITRVGARVAQAQGPSPSAFRVSETRSGEGAGGAGAYRNSESARRGGASPEGNYGNRTLSESFAYDGYGNRITSDDGVHGFWDRSLGTEVHVNAGKPYQLTSATTNVAGGLYNGSLTVAYDAMGNTTSLSVVRPGVPCLPANAECSKRYAYGWDEVNRLVRARRWDGPNLGNADTAFPLAAPAVELKYAYDAGDSRVRTTIVDPANASELHTLYIFGSLELRRTDYQSGVAEYTRDDRVEAVYLVANGVKLGKVVSPNAGVPAPQSGVPVVLLTVADTLGSTSVIIDRASGELVENRGYRAYGDEEHDCRTSRWQNLREEYGFTGKEADVEVGLTYFGKRFLVPSIGRWLNVDPLALHAPGSADANVYAYVSGRVFSAVDPLGLDGAYPNADDPNAGWARDAIQPAAAEQHLKVEARLMDRFVKTGQTFVQAEAVQPAKPASPKPLTVTEMRDRRAVDAAKGAYSYAVGVAIGSEKVMLWPLGAGHSVSEFVSRKLSLAPPPPSPLTWLQDQLSAAPPPKRDGSYDGNEREESYRDGGRVALVAEQTVGFAFSGVSEAGQIALKRLAADGELSLISQESHLVEGALSAGCLAAGTALSSAGIGVAIESVSLGDRVDAADGESDSSVEPATWQEVWVRSYAPNDATDTVDVHLLRPNAWVERLGVAPGRRVWIDLGEFGHSGFADVIAVGPCPQIPSGAGRVVTGTFTHSRAEVLELKVVGPTLPVVATPSHRFFSETRSQWVDAGKLRSGEMLRTPAGPIAVDWVSAPIGDQRVYNIEVETSHTYFVGGSRVLVHNAGPDCSPRVVKLAPDPVASGSHSTFKRGPNGDIVAHAEWDANGMPVKRTDITDKVQHGIERPHTHEYSKPNVAPSGRVYPGNELPARPATSDETPKPKP